MDIVKGINDLFKTKGDDGYYQRFYSAFLTTANSLPINSLWVVKINKIPTDKISTTVYAYEGWVLNSDTLNIASNVNRTDKSGLIIAQGVKIVGDSEETIRAGTKNTGYIQGLVGQGRTSFPLLNISLLENNLSFADYVLRPWSVAVSHASLKEQSLKTVIDVVFYSKMGPRESLSPRKIFKYYDCCPVSVNEEEYNYSGSDVYRLRQTQFAFNKYEIIENVNAGESLAALLKLIGATGTEAGFLGGLQNSLKNELQRQFGANSVDQYIGNMVDKAQQLGADVISGTAKRIVTNVAGSIQDKINGAITNVTSTVRGGATNLVNSVNDATNRALGNVSRSNSNATPLNSANKNLGDTLDNVNTAKRIGANKAGFGGYKEKKTNQDDYAEHVQKSDINRPNPHAVVDVNKIINQEDAPNHVEQIDVTNLNAGRSNNKTPTDPNTDTYMLGDALKYNLRKSDPPMNDVRHGDINHQDVEKKINQNDYVQNLSLNSETDKQINKADIPNRNSIKFNIKTINQDDAPIHKKNS